MLSVYAKWKGAGYLKATLQKVVERLMLTSKDLNLELDPTKVNTEEERQKNAIQLQIVAKVFIDDICASSVNIPDSFRKICSIVSPLQTAEPEHVGAHLLINTDLCCRDATISRSKVHSCRGLHILAVLLSSYRRS
jgi:hypothetical protein